ncbi:MAG: hypothetical protein WCH01_18150, partial [Methylococcaceae bacterium]
LKELEVIKEIKAEIDGKPPVDRVWDAKIKKQQTLIRGSWLGAATELKETPDPTDKALPDEIKRFVAAMPKIDTERHEIKGRLIERFSIQREKAQTIHDAEHAAISQTDTIPQSKEPKPKELEM